MNVMKDVVVVMQESWNSSVPELLFKNISAYEVWDSGDLYLWGEDKQMQLPAAVIYRGRWNYVKRVDGEDEQA